MAKRTIGKPRFYADIPQYLKALGYYDGSVLGNPNIWNMNPYQQNSLSLGLNTFNINKPSEELTQLLTNGANALDLSTSSGIYFGALGVDSIDIDYIQFALGNDDGFVEIDFENIINATYLADSQLSFQYKGYGLANVTGFAGFSSDIRFFSYANVSNPSNVGSVSYGRWFEPSHAFDLGLTMVSDYEGVSLQKTISGYTYSNSTHLGVPMWGDIPAWTIGKQEGHDYKIGGTDGRRQWDVSLSFLSDDDLFSKARNENKFFTYNPDSGGYTFDESIASFLGLTFNGKIPFIFCPDSSATDLEFALCMIDEDSLSFDQVAYQTWDVSMSIVEVW